jgi:hypothetical protein
MALGTVWATDSWAANSWAVGSWEDLATLVWKALAFLSDFEAIPLVGITNAGTPGTPTNGIEVLGKDSSDAATTLHLNMEQAVEAIGTFTPSHKIKIYINGVEYWLQLDAV